MSKSKRREKSEVTPHVARASKKVILSMQNRRERKQHSVMWKRQWGEEVATDMQ